jgi:hypothetical protein
LTSDDALSSRASQWRRAIRPLRQWGWRGQSISNGQRAGPIRPANGEPAGHRTSSAWASSGGFIARFMTAGDDRIDYENISGSGPTGGAGRARHRDSLNHRSDGSRTNR